MLRRSGGPRVKRANGKSNVGRKADPVVDELALALAKTELEGSVGKGTWEYVRDTYFTSDETFADFQYKKRGAARRLWKKLQKMKNPQRGSAQVRELRVVRK